MSQSRWVVIAVPLAITMAAILTGCATNDPRLADAGAGAKADLKDLQYMINSQKGSIAGIEIGMSEDELRKSGWPFEARLEIVEGDEYRIFDVHLAGGAVLTGTFDLETNLHRIESASTEVRDEHGLGVGSLLSDLKQFYADGRLIKGEAEGRFANFLTGTRLIFHFDPQNLDERCFDHGEDCTIDEGLVVRSVSIGKYSPK